MNPFTGHIVANIDDVKDIYRKDYQKVDEITDEYKEIKHKAIQALGDKKEVYITPKSKDFRAMTDDMKTRHFAKLIEDMAMYPNGWRISKKAKEERVKELLRAGFKIQAIYEKLKKEGY